MACSHKPVPAPSTQQKRHLKVNPHTVKSPNRPTKSTKWWQKWSPRFLAAAGIYHLPNFQLPEGNTDSRSRPNGAQSSPMTSKTVSKAPKMAPKKAKGSQWSTSGAICCHLATNKSIQHPTKTLHRKSVKYKNATRTR